LEDLPLCQSAQYTLIKSTIYKMLTQLPLSTSRGLIKSLPFSLLQIGPSTRVMDIFSSPVTNINRGLREVTLSDPHIHVHITDAIHWNAIKVTRNIPRDKAFLGELTIIQQMDKLRAFYQNRIFINAFKKANYWTVSWARGFHTSHRLFTYSPSPSSLFHYNLRFSSKTFWQLFSMTYLPHAFSSLKNGIDYFTLLSISKRVNYKTAHVAIFNPLIFFYLNFVVNRGMHTETKIR
jgi:hypothetical protein